MSPVERAKLGAALAWARAKATAMKLDNWRPWMVIAYLGLVIAVAGLFHLNGEQSKAEAERVAQREAANQQEVADCRQRIATIPNTKLAFELLGALADDRIKTQEAANAVRSPGDPLIGVTKGSLRRIRPKYEKLRPFLKRISDLKVPTKAECDALASLLGVSSKQ